MTAPLVRDETFTLRHRATFFAGSARDTHGGRSPGWSSRGRHWSATRPEDGEPPADVTVVCPVCSRPLQYRLYSVAAAAKIRATLRWAALAVAVVAVAGVVLAVQMIGISDDTSLPDAERDAAVPVAVTGVVLAMAGLTGASGLVLRAGAQLGVAGSGAGAAGNARHVVGRQGE